MTFAFKGLGGAVGSATANQASTTLTTATTAGAAGDLAILLIAVDNAQTTDGDENAVTSVTDNSGAGNNWLKAGEFTNGQGTAQTGATCGIWYCDLNGALPTGSVITVNFSNSTLRDASGLSLALFTTTAATVLLEGTPTTLANDGAAAGSMNGPTASTSVEILRIRATASEANANTVWTKTAAFDGLFTVGVSTGGTSAAKQGIRGEYDISTGNATLASAPTGGAGAVDNASLYVCFKEFGVSIAATFAGAGALSPNSSLISVQRPISATFAGDGGLAADATVVTGANTYPIEATLAGVGSLAADVTVVTGGGEEPAVAGGIDLPIPYRRGQKKPWSSIPRIDWSHPLAAGLVAYFYDMGGVYVDLVGGALSEISSASFVAPSGSTPFGQATIYPTSTGSGDGRTIYGNSKSRNIFSAVPYSVACGFAGPVGGDNCALLCCYESSGAGFAFQIQRANSNDLRIIYPSNSNITTSASTATANVFHTAVANAITSTSAEVICDGKSAGTASFGTTVAATTSAGFPVTFNGIHRFGGGGGSGGLALGAVYYAAQWDRNLTVAEAKLLHDDPYCFLVYPEDEMLAATLAPAAVEPPAEVAGGIDLPIPYRRGQKKPWTSIPRINKDHPLANGLVSYIYDCGGVFVDLILGQIGEVVQTGAGAGGYPTSSPFGGDMLFGKVSNSPWMRMPLNSVHPNFMASPFSIAIGLYNFSTMASGQILSLSDNSANTIFQIESYQGFSDHRFQIKYAVQPGGQSFLTGGNDTNPNIYHTAVATATGSTSGQVFLDGVSEGTFSSGNTFYTQAGARICLNNLYPAGALGNNVIDGIVPYIACWNRPLTAAEAKLLHDDPYCVLIYPEDEMAAATLVPSAAPPGGNIYQIAATFNGVGGLTAQTTQWMTAAATFGGIGGLSANARKIIDALTFAGVGGIIAQSAQRMVVAATLAGAGGLVADAIVAKPITASFAGVGGLTANAQVARAASATFAGVGGLTTQLFTLTMQASATFAGAGALAANVTPPGATAHPIAATFAGVGGLSADVQKVINALTFAGVGGLTASLALPRAITASFAGVGGLSANAVIAQSIGAIFAGVGGLAANVTTAAKTISASFAGVGSLTANPRRQSREFKTASGNWTVPANVVAVQIEGIGAGAPGSPGASPALESEVGAGGIGGGGGAYARVDAFAVSPGNVYAFVVSTGDTTFNTSTMVAKAASGSTGGQASASTGDVKFSGGNGVSNGTNPGGSGGGAAGPFGAGLSGGAQSGSSGGTGGRGDNNVGGLGGGGGLTFNPGNPGGSGTELQLSPARGSGGGGGGGGGVGTGNDGVGGGAGGLYGAGGGGGSGAINDEFAHVGGSGGARAQGLLWLTYTYSDLALYPITTSLDGVGNLAASTTQRMAAVATFAGAGGLTADLTPPPAQTYSISASFAGVGGLSANARKAINALTFAGVGGLAAQSTQRLALVATFAGAGNFTAQSTQRMAARVVFAGAGGLFGNVTPPGAQVYPLAATFAGSGGLTAATAMRMPSSASFAGVGSLSASLSQVINALKFSGVGGLAAAASQRLATATTFAGAGNLAAQTTQRMAASVLFAGAGSLSANVTPPAAQSYPISASFAGVGALTANALVAKPISASSFAGVGGLTAATAMRMPSSATFAGAGSLTANAIKSSSGTGALAAGAAQIAGTGNPLSADTGVLLAASATLAGSGSSISINSVPAALPAGTAQIAGAAERYYVASGVLAAGGAQLAGSGTSKWHLSGALNAGAAQIAGAGVSFSFGSGALPAQQAALAGVGARYYGGTGTLAAGAAQLVGIASSVAEITGALLARRATVTGTIIPVSIGDGDLAAQAVALHGSGNVFTSDRIDHYGQVYFNVVLERAVRMTGRIDRAVGLEVTLHREVRIGARVTRRVQLAARVTGSLKKREMA